MSFKRQTKSAVIQRHNRNRAVTMQHNYADRVNKTNAALAHTYDILNEANEQLVQQRNARIDEAERLAEQRWQQRDDLFARVTNQIADLNAARSERFEEQKEMFKEQRQSLADTNKTRHLDFKRQYRDGLSRHRTQVRLNAQQAMLGDFDS